MTTRVTSVADAIGCFAAVRARFAADEYCNLFARSKTDCESPIEEIMLGVLLLLGGARGALPVVLNEMRGSPLAESRMSRFRNAEHEYFTHGSTCVIAPQFKIGKYRVDFCVLFPACRPSDNFHLVVECDGHDFHERTKEQAQRDKSRDRAIQAAGYQVLRFTGSEIWNNCIDCGKEVFSAAQQEWWRRHRKQLEEDTAENRSWWAERDEAIRLLRESDVATGEAE